MVVESWFENDRALFDFYSGFSRICSTPSRADVLQMMINCPVNAQQVAKMIQPVLLHHLSIIRCSPPDGGKSDQQIGQERTNRGKLRTLTTVIQIVNNFQFTFASIKTIQLWHEETLNAI